MTPNSTPQGVNPGPIAVAGTGWGLLRSQIKLVFALDDQSHTAVHGNRASQSNGVVGDPLSTTASDGLCWNTNKHPPCDRRGAARDRPTAAESRRRSTGESRSKNAVARLPPRAQDLIAGPATL